MSPRPRHSTGRSHRWRWVIVLILALMAAGLLLREPVYRVLDEDQLRTDPLSAEPAPAATPVSTGAAEPVLVGNDDTPPAGVGSSPEPLGIPQPLQLASSAWVPARTQPDSDEPVRWDPCRPIHYVSGPDAPPGAQQMVRSSLQRVSQITGLVFIDDGATDEVWSFDRQQYQPQRYGQRWAPVLISWVSPQQLPELEGEVIAQSGALSARKATGPSIYVSGAMALDGPQVEAEIAAGNSEQVEAIVLHEVGHLVGLGHIDDPDQLMNPQVGSLRDFAAGDLTGLQIMGSGPCAPQM